MKTYRAFIPDPDGNLGEIHSRGASAYEVALANNYIGTQAEWLESLKGAKGDQGLQGIQGEKGEKGDQGETGPQGEQGISPTIIENENNDDDTYKLDITDANGTFTTPNLKGATGSSSVSGEEIKVDLSDYYTKNEVDSKIADTIKKEIVSELPTENINENTIYMILMNDRDNNDIYDEYMYIDGYWELIGNTRIDLSNYYTKEEIDDTITPLKEASHTHDNKDTLDKWVEYGDGLTYNGEVVNLKGASIKDNDYSEDTTLSSTKIVALIEEAVETVKNSNNNTSSGSTVEDTHTNREVLDLFSVDDDYNLMFNGEYFTSYIDDNKISDKLTYSSSKIQALVNSAVGNISDDTSSTTTTYSSSKIDELLAKINTDTVETNDSILVPFETATDAQIDRMINAYYSGEITLRDVQTVWHIGDKRSVHLLAMDNLTYPEDYDGSQMILSSYPEQDIYMVICDFDKDPLTEPIGDITNSLVTLVQNNLLGYFENNSYLVTPSPMILDIEETSEEGKLPTWETCLRRAWCNNIYYNALDSATRKRIKTVKKYTYNVNEAALKTVDDKCFILSQDEFYDFENEFGTPSVEGEGTCYGYFKSNTYYMNDTTIYAGNVKTIDDAGSTYSVSSGWTWMRTNNVDDPSSWAQTSAYHNAGGFYGGTSNGSSDGLLIAFNF